MHILFLQPFGIGFPGGGARILRGLLQNASVSWTSVNTSHKANPRAPFGNEIHIPFRPSFGRFEYTRFNLYFLWFDKFFATSFKRRLISVCKECNATAIHAIPHGLDFIEGWRVSKILGCNFFLSIHDDLEYNIRYHPLKIKALRNFPEIWREADARFVISDQLGKEYCSRYGNRDYKIVTDGVKKITSARIRKPKKLNIYFMGLFHISYEPNLAALLAGINFITAAYQDWKINVVMRGVQFRRSFRESVQVRLLPFGTDADVQKDLNEADLLYLPLPFGCSHKNFVRFSLSTKMVTYLGSGLPIFFHGPNDAAASELLSQHKAALICNSLDSNQIESSIRHLIENPDLAKIYVDKASALAKEQFMLTDQHYRFWKAINSILNFAP